MSLLGPIDRQSVTDIFLKQALTLARPVTPACHIHRCIDAGSQTIETSCHNYTTSGLLCHFRCRNAFSTPGACRVEHLRTAHFVQHVICIKRASVMLTYFDPLLPSLGLSLANVLAPDTAPCHELIGRFCTLALSLFHNIQQVSEQDIL